MYEAHFKQYIKRQWTPYACLVHQSNLYFEYNRKSVFETIEKQFSINNLLFIFTYITRYKGNVVPRRNLVE